MFLLIQKDIILFISIQQSNATIIIQDKQKSKVILCNPLNTSHSFMTP
jgi:hypothetical protein